MDYSSFIILLARQRSGTNVLRSVLKHHPDFFCLPEVFEYPPAADWRLAVNTSYFGFLERYTKGDMKKIWAQEDHEVVFLDYLEYLRCFTDKKHVVIDVKYMSMHHVTAQWRFVTEEPFLFSLIKKHNLQVLNLTRKNFLRYYLSEMKAQETKSWYAFDESVVGKQDWYLSSKKLGGGEKERRIVVDTNHLLETLALCQTENALVEHSFVGHQGYLSFDYDDMFPFLGSPIAEPVLGRIAQWLGIEGHFPQSKPEYKKQSILRLEETIANYDEVVAALRGTKFEYCLEDEKIYSSLPISA